MPVNAHRADRACGLIRSRSVPRSGAALSVLARNCRSTRCRWPHRRSGRRPAARVTGAFRRSRRLAPTPAWSSLRRRGNRVDVTRIGVIQQRPGGSRASAFTIWCCPTGQLLWATERPSTGRRASDSLVALRPEGDRPVSDSPRAPASRRCLSRLTRGRKGDRAGEYAPPYVRFELRCRRSRTSGSLRLRREGHDCRRARGDAAQRSGRLGGLLS